MSTPTTYVYAALQAGAAGFLLKNSQPEQLTDAIRIIAKGEAVLSPSTAQRLITALTKQPAMLAPSRSPRDDLIGRLTDRELDVLTLLAKGQSNTEIADNLGLTESNVRSRVNRIMTRLQADNRVQAALIAYRAGLVPDPEP
jgi:DNA-binding NarL/FixJ family response regulator